MGGKLKLGRGAQFRYRRPFDSTFLRPTERPRISAQLTRVFSNSLPPHDLELCRGVPFTVSLAVCSSMVDNAQSLELATMVGRPARQPLGICHPD